MGISTEKLKNFDNPDKIIDSMNKIITQSSMVSVFEKIKFRDMVKSLSNAEKAQLSLGLKEFLHGDKKTGFEIMIDLLSGYSLAKWPLLTLCPYYYSPYDDVFIKPTTVKMIIERFEFEGIKYNPKPSFEFYIEYSKQLKLLKEAADESLKIDNAAFCGFLMITKEDA